MADMIKIYYPAMFNEYLRGHLLLPFGHVYAHFWCLNLMRHTIVSDDNERASPPVRSLAGSELSTS
jgi:hypothetical protein